MKNDKILVSALERIADPLNTHFKGDAQIVAREALKEWNESKAHECQSSSNGKHLWSMFGDQSMPRCNWCGDVSTKSWKALVEEPEAKSTSAARSMMQHYRTVMVEKPEAKIPSVFFVRQDKTTLQLSNDIDEAARQLSEETAYGTVMSDTIEGFPEIECRGSNDVVRFFAEVRRVYARFPELNKEKWVMVGAPKLKELRAGPATLEELQAFIVGLTEQYNRLAVDFVDHVSEKTKSDRNQPYGLL